MFLDELGLSGDFSDAMRATIRLLLRQVRPFLARRDGRTDFFYEAFQIAARRRYAREEPDSCRWHTRLARTCERWSELEGATGRYALRNLVHHSVEAGNCAAAAEALTDFAYHHERLRALGREDIEDVTADFSLPLGESEFSSELRARYRTWKRFHSQSSHLLRRTEHPPGLPQTTLFQLAMAHSDTSPVTAGAERWLEEVGSEVHWLRLLGRSVECYPSSCLRTFEQTRGLYPVAAWALLPDGRRAVSGFRISGTVALWDLDTGKCLRIFEGHSRDVCAIASLPDGRRVISGSHDGSLKLWNVETGQCLRTFLGHTRSVTTVAIVPTRVSAISGSVDGTLRLWDVETGQCLRTFRGHAGVVRAVAIHPDGRRALSAGDDETLRLWEIETGSCSREIREHAGTPALLSDGRRVLSSSSKMFEIWDLESGRRLRTFEKHGNWVRFALSADTRRAISGSEDGKLSLYDVETGKCLHTIEAHTSGVNSVLLFPDGRHALSGGQDGTAKFWDLETSPPPCAPSSPEDKGHASLIETVAILPDGRRALSGGWDHTIKLWDIDRARCLRTLKGHRGQVECLGLLLDGRRALSSSADRTIKLWDLETGEVMRTFQPEVREGHTIAILSDGRRVLLRNQETIKVWDLEQGRCLHTLQGHTAMVSGVAVASDGRRAVSWSSDKTIRVWDLDAGQCLHTLTVPYIKSGGAGLLPVGLLPDGRRAVLGEFGGTLGLWDLETGKCLQMHEDCMWWCQSIAISPDAPRVAGFSSYLKILDFDANRGLAAWEPDDKSIRSCAIRADLVAIGTQSGEVLFLKLMPPGRITPETSRATWHPSRPLLAVARANGTILVQAWHPASQYIEELARCPGSPVERLQWSCDGAHLRVVARDGTARILDATTLHEAAAPAHPWADPRDLSSDNQWRAVIRDGRLDLTPAGKE
jgi:WD40 repeat protein